MANYSTWLRENDGTVNDIIAPWPSSAPVQKLQVAIEDSPPPLMLNQPTRTAQGYDPQADTQTAAAVEIGAENAAQIDKAKTELAKGQQGLARSNTQQQISGIVQDLSNSQPQEWTTPNASAYHSGSGARIQPDVHQDSPSKKGNGLAKIMRIVGAVYSSGATEAAKKAVT